MRKRLVPLLLAAIVGLAASTWHLHVKAKAVIEALAQSELDYATLERHDAYYNQLYNDCVYILRLNSLKCQPTP